MPSSAGVALSDVLLTAVRGLGIERGVDTVLHVVFSRWLTLTRGMEDAWSTLALHARHDSVGFEPFARLGSLGVVAPSSVGEPEAVNEVTRRLVALIDDFLVDSLDEPEAVLVDAFEAVLGSLSRLGRQSGEVDMPHALADLMAALTVRPGDHVVDPVCGHATGLLAAARAQPGVSVAGTDINHRAAWRAVMRLVMHDVRTVDGRAIVRDDAFEAHQPGSADVVLAQPPWGIPFLDRQNTLIEEVARRYEGSASSRRSAFGKGDMPWLLLGMDALRPNGRAAILMAGASLTARFAEAHEELLVRSAVEAIILLPPGLFEHTSVRTVLWLLRSAPAPWNAENVLMVDAQTLMEPTTDKRVEIERGTHDRLVSLIEEYRRTGTLAAPDHIARIVDLDEIDLRRGLNPSLYLAAPPTEAITHPVPDRTLLTEIGLANFKAFGERTSIPLAPLTLVYGANSAGKSSIIQSLLMLQQSRASGTLITQGRTVNLGGFTGLVHRHSDAPVEISLTYGVLPTWIPEAGTPNPRLPRRVTWTFSANKTGQGIADRTVVQFGDHQLTFTRDPDDGDQLVLTVQDLEQAFYGIATGTLLYPFDSRHRTDGNQADQLKRQRGRESNARRALRALIRDGHDRLPVRPDGILPGDTITPPGGSHLDEREHGIVGSYVNRTGRLAGGIADEISHLLANLVWIGPLRSAPQRVYDRADTTATPGDGRHVAIYLYDHTTVVEHVNEWLEQLEIPYTLDVMPLTTGADANLIGDLVALALTDNRTGVNITPADVGYGISQVLPIVVELLARRDSVIAIEQPETHLHPRLQARLADLFIDATQEGGRGNQLIVETHSEHLMLRLQRRIREGTLDARAVSVLYIDRTPDGHTTVKRLRLNDQGDFLDEWPNGFFDERLDELFGAF